ncbi:Zinc finger CCHC domain-containing protein 8 [Camellia lanceoleosa]|uniref:Zinc finger CCHC domain-containing protein 8 n=1 Tax=Camellia lanceoleosa TaxID=1840588 RepID=A0ACC0GSQ2_9ERIC|nr:Zinc finger CCHC domain-containing protein 8 [Camellia lanceoleosa]
METEDLIDLPPSSNSGYKSVNDNLHDSECEPSDADSQPINCELKEDKLNEEISGTPEVDVGNGDSQLFMSADIDRDLIGCSSILQASIKLNETISVAEDVKCFSSGIQSENGCVTGQEGSPISNRKRDESPISYHEISDNSISGVKKARMIFDKQQPSVHVKYNSLTRDSKRELEELLQQWSKWHAQHCSSSHDSNEVLESGEEMFFPALFVGLDNPSAVSFWMDNQTRNQMSEEFIALDRKSVPLYDRGYSLEGGLKVADASRCFNCDSYNHSLKECPKPRDHVAVNNARKQHKSRHNKNAGSRNPTRYYQYSAGGKYDGLRPGVLDAETRKLLGLGELDPPPWLNRMRQMGYPPGYLDPEVEEQEQPSGITIFTDEGNKEEKEDDGEIGKILEKVYPDLPRKMSAEFPGINAPIPENADERRWTTAGPSSSDLAKNQSHCRSNFSMEPISRDMYHRQRWSRDIRNEGPPGIDPGFSPTLSGYTSQSAQGNISVPISPSFGRTMSDGGRSPLVYEGSLTPGSHSSVPSLSQYRLFSQQNYGSASFEKKRR